MAHLLFDSSEPVGEIHVIACSTAALLKPERTKHLQFLTLMNFLLLHVGIFSAGSVFFIMLALKAVGTLETLGTSCCKCRYLCYNVDM